MNKWSDFYQAGLAKENEFGDLLIEKNGGSYVHASSRDDMWNHIDLFYTKDDKTYSFFSLLRYLLKLTILIAKALLFTTIVFSNYTIL